MIVRTKYVFVFNVALRHMARTNICFVHILLVYNRNLNNIFLLQTIVYDSNLFCFLILKKFLPKSCRNFFVHELDQKMKNNF